MTFFQQYNLDVSEQRSTDGSQTTEQQDEKNSIYSDSQKIEGTYPHKQFKSSRGEKSVLANSTEDTTSSIFGDFCSEEKNCTSFKELLDNHRCNSTESGRPAERMELTRGRNKENHILKMEVEKPQDSEKGSSKTTESYQNSQGKYCEFPTPPPLPKSPSDSWLCRTLPSMSSRNAVHSNGIGTHPRNHQNFKTQSTDAKWEMIVKTTNIHHHNFRYAEVLEKLLLISL